FTTDLATPCRIDDPSTWQYQVTPFCEPELIPGTPNISVGMEQFNDTPVVNGTAYPTTTLDPKAYRFRILNAANDRFWNLSWYVADSTGTEVALKASEVAAAQTDINVVPTPDTTLSPAGPDWIQIGSEGGFLPAPAVVPAQPTTWITDPTRFDVGNVDQHSMLLAPAERSDVIVDFSKYAGKTLILYNDAPAAFPARVASYDYYTGAPDTGAGAILPGYGPNTRTVMQVKIADAAPAPAFDLTALKSAFKHHADGSGVFESGQHPIIVGQAAYNSAYGTTFAASGDCTNATGTNTCDGFARINQQGRDLFRFDNLKASNPQLTVPIEPKAIHDEMNSTSFDEFGRMTANLGLEAVPATPGTQNVMLYPYVAPPTEVIDGTNLPKGDVNVQAISDGSDGTQIWKITHNGVDTHPIHFHLYDVQVLNRVTWDNIIIPPEASELGWKDTVRVSPLEDTIVALRPIIPTLPFEIPNSIRELNPMMLDGANLDPNGLIMDPAGNVTTLTNALVNFGWEYVYHCHILSHEEMDMMRPVLMALPPNAAVGLTRSITGNGNNRRNVLSWTDDSIAETSYIVQKSPDGITWTEAATSPSPLDVANTKGARSATDTTSGVNAALLYRVVARNTVGYGGAYPSVNADSLSSTIAVNPPSAAPAAPTLLTAALQAGPQVRLQWRDNATNEAGFVIERATAAGGPFTRIAVAPARNNTGNQTFTDTTIATGTAYWYRVAAVNLFGGVSTLSAYSNTATTAASAAVPAAPSTVVAANGASQGNKRSVTLTWKDNSTNETGFTIEQATNATFTTGLKSTTAAADAVTASLTGLSKATTYYVRIRANNAVGSSAWVNATPFPIVTQP
ncbi:multicopper oxidase domain-containing protein, partial [Actinotalea sp.]|uniref:multicopper oxidase domain-containing protein n=1 Tax=Actinotalea sp. TaxID=1872145 RepID=UPI003562DEE9